MTHPPHPELLPPPPPPPPQLEELEKLEQLDTEEEQFDEPDVVLGPTIGIGRGNTVSSTTMNQVQKKG